MPNQTALSDEELISAIRAQYHFRPSPKPQAPRACWPGMYAVWCG